MSLQLRAETAEALAAIASARGLSVEEYLQELIDREIPAKSSSGKSVFEEGLGLFGSPEDAALLDEVVTMAYEERRRHSKSSNVR
jgi:hypothetical protein